MSPLRRLLVAVAAVTILLSAACLGPSARGFMIGGEGAHRRDIRVEVVNDNFLDMGIFVMEGSSSFRLGDVVGKNSATFMLDPDQISPSSGLRLLADPVGSRDAYLSDPIHVDGGAIVVLHIAPALSQSFVTLR